MKLINFLKVSVILFSFLGASALADATFCATNHTQQPITVWCGQYWGFAGIPIRYSGYVNVAPNADKFYFYTAENNWYQANIDRGYWYCYLYDQNGEQLSDNRFTIYNEQNNVNVNFINLGDGQIVPVAHVGAGVC